MPTFPANDFQIGDPSDGTKLLDFDISAQTSGTGFQRTVSAVDYPGVMVLADAENSGGTLKLLFHYGSSTTAPTWSDPDLPDDLFRISDNSDSSKKLALECSGITSSSTVTLTAPDLSVTIAGVAGAINATAQAAAIGSTTLASKAGYYVVNYTIEDTTADVTAGTIQFQIGYTDDVGATTQTGAALALTATGRDRGAFQVYLASGNLTYQTNLVGIIGSARYALRVRATYLS